jgi:hypothetical protein
VTCNLTVTKQAARADDRTAPRNEPGFSGFARNEFDDLLVVLVLFDNRIGKIPKIDKFSLGVWNRPKAVLAFERN